MEAMLRKGRAAPGFLVLSVELQATRRVERSILMQTFSED
ncbi:hypothetical protein N826_36355 [Skermanella aerolata KACC 11604]|nr:hypothetical protein N826_36355 [Skermanella aerolata KACC 11604]